MGAATRRGSAQRAQRGRQQQQPQGPAGCSSCDRGDARGGQSQESCCGRFFSDLRARHGLPVTRFQWRMWLSDHEREFRELMKTASAQRKSRSQRLRARGDLPMPVNRIQPQANARYKPSARWAQILWLRDGWHGVRTDRGMSFLFLCHLRGDTFSLDLDGLRESSTERQFVITTRFCLQERLKRFEEFEAAHQGACVSSVHSSLLRGKQHIVASCCESYAAVSLRHL